MKVWTMLIAWGVCGLHAHGGLVWEEEEKAVQLVNCPSSYKCEFNFKNTGNNTVVVDKIKATCGCTTASSAKREYKPGEAGSINVQVKLDGRKGLFSNQVVVESTDAVTVLKLVLEIPSLAEVSSERLVWGLHEGNNAKVVKVSARRGKCSVSDVKMSNNDFACESERQEDGTYCITVTPKGTDLPRRGMCVFKVKFEDGISQAYSVLAIVR